MEWGEKAICPIRKQKLKQKYGEKSFLLVKKCFKGESNPSPHLLKSSTLPLCHHNHGLRILPVAFFRWEVLQADLVFEVALPTHWIETSASAVRRVQQCRCDSDLHCLT